MTAATSAPNVIRIAHAISIVGGGSGATFGTHERDDAFSPMGRAYAKGWTRAANYMKALPYYRKGAEWDHRVAMMDYGKMLIHGAGTQADPVLGRQWIEKAARAGLSHAQYALGDLAHKGIGGPKNLNEFLKWTQAAADQEFRKPTATLECFS